MRTQRKKIVRKKREILERGNVLLNAHLQQCRSVSLV